LREVTRAPFKNLSAVDLTLTISLGVTGCRPVVVISDDRRVINRLRW
jgi:hypothetical protein